MIRCTFHHMTAILSPFDEGDFYTRERFPDADVPFEHFQPYIGELEAEQQKAAILVVEREHYEVLKATENFQDIDRVFWGTPGESGLSSRLAKQVARFERARGLSGLRSQTRSYRRELVARDYYVVDKTEQDVTAASVAVAHEWCGPEFPYMVQSYYETVRHTGFFYMEHGFQVLAMKDALRQEFAPERLCGHKEHLAAAMTYRDALTTPRPDDDAIQRFVDAFQDGQSFWYYRT